MKFEYLAPKWDKKLKKASMFDMEGLNSFNTCIMGEVTEKLGLPTDKISYFKEGNNTKVEKIPRCKGCWTLGVQTYKTITSGQIYDIKPTRIKEGISNFYKTVVPKIETHMRLEHRIDI